MPKLSHKADQMPASPIRKLMPSADIAMQKGLNVYHLNIGQPDIPSPIQSIEAMHEWNIPVLAYTRSEGTLEYREALTTYYHGKGFSDLTPSNFMVTNGGSEALLFTLSLIANAGDEIIIPEPFYANYNGFSVQTDVNVVPISASIESGFALPDIADFEKKITDKTRAIVICHPGNPTGYLYSKEELDKLRDLVLKHDLYLISDEVYREFTYDENHISVLAYPDLAQNAIVIDSESKRFSMCGIRLGAMISRNEELLAAAMKFAQARLSPVLVSQIIATAAHRESAGYLMQAKAEYSQRRNFVVDALNRIDGVFVPKPKGAFYCVAKLPVENAEDFAKWMLEDFEYNGETVMVAPNTGFYSTPNSGLDEVRIAYVLEISELDKAVKILEKGLEAYRAR
ncbi:pyridoxal phosphate-dependent aminotransferase [Weeksellaceae bacterium KMM 9724]|uniref:pyridoxal phosphate-dependent aminotransferase n=1 Tax=Profundicola chukchiensis TaxID=2961959 RepID=UPI0024389C31|nr:pyridoxal phosphate-dependent aminotransferase [Profundicola chukchiensis]MDG4950054.1 pyridoxal phosphate-dependent aminotransferase [Profundicola chukchiensis]